MIMNPTKNVMHPSLAELKDFKQSGEPPVIAEHITSCERCQSILEGMEHLDTIANASNLSTDQLIDQSNTRVKQRFVDRPKRKFTFIKFAASLLIIAGIGWVVMNRSGEERNLLESEITTMYKAPPLLRSNGKEDWARFSILYQESNFTEAFDLLESMEGKSGQTEFYKGLCKIYQSNPDYHQAIIFLSDPQVKKSRYVQQATYISALCYLKINDFQNAKKTLTQILQRPNHYKINESAELFETLP